MIFLDDRIVKEKILYKKSVFLPIIKNTKTKGAMCFLLSPTFEESIQVLQSNLLDNKFYSGYYIEKDITYFINQENAKMSKDSDIITEDSDVLDMNYSLPIHMFKDTEFNDEYMRCVVDGKDILFAFPEYYNNITEAVAANNPMLKKILYQERLRTPKDVFAVYDTVADELKKNGITSIDKMYININKYKKFNMFVDLSYYNQTFFRNNIWKLDKGVQLYFDFITRFLKDPRFKEAGYEKSTIILPVFGWTNKKQLVYTNEINTLSMIYRMIATDFDRLKSEWGGMNFVLLGKKAFMKIDFANLTEKDISKFKLCINNLIIGNNADAVDLPDSGNGIKTDLIDRIEKSQNISLDRKSFTGTADQVHKDELKGKLDKAEDVTGEDIDKAKTLVIDKINTASELADDEADAIEMLDNDEEFKQLLVQISSTQNTEVKINATRSARMEKLNNEIKGKKINDQSLEDLLEYKQVEKLPVTELPIDSINPEWKNMKYMNFEKAYNIDADIAKILEFFYTRSLPVAMRDIEVVDASTSEDWIYTYNVQCEDYNGQRFRLIFDIPKFKDNRYMYLRGNEKILNGQLMNLPITKTDDNAVQIVTNYNKVFVRTFGQNGKACVYSYKIIKTMNKLVKDNYTAIKVTHGDNTRVNAKYALPIDYIDLSSEFSRLETKDYIIFFNQDDIRKKYNIDFTITDIPFAVRKSDNKIFYLDPTKDFASSDILTILMENNKFAETFEKIGESSKYTYSKASILGTEIPVIVILGYYNGLLDSMKEAGIEFTVEKPRTKYNPLTHDAIKFKDGMVIYSLTSTSSMLMNGIKECDTSSYSIGDIGTKEMYMDFLDQYGGRIKADGLDNFLDLMVDPITLDILQTYKLPETFTGLLIYANELLEDNKYIRHADLAGKRFRTNEIIAAILYKELSTSYGTYKNKAKRNVTGNAMTIKKTAVIDTLLELKTSSDASILNALLDVEAGNTVSFKGLSGMNADRAYSLDKRRFDDSMINTLAMATGFSANVGINRQTTLDMEVNSTRGYLNPDTNKEVSLKSLSVTEALTPYGINHDDPFRQAMTFIQTSKHYMRTEVSNPRIITTGADEALGYMASNNFAFKAKKAGTVVEKEEGYIVVKYSDNTYDYINLDNKMVKNSSGGFYGNLKLDSDMKVGNKFKGGDILAYDKGSFDPSIGASDNISYSAGTLAKMAIIYHEDGIEDSGVCTEWLSEAMTSSVIMKTEVYLDSPTNVYSIKKIGDHVEEGDPLITFQEATHYADINDLMKRLGADEDEISELGRRIKISHYTGTVVDVKIYRTADIADLSDSLKTIVNRYEKGIKDKKSVMQKYKIDQEYTLPANYKLEQQGKLKNIQNGVLIEFYVEFKDKFKIGDKDVLDAALKNTIHEVIPKGKEPYSEFRPNEEISTLAALNSIEGRMVASITNNCCLLKILIELDRAVKEKLGIKWKTLQEMSNITVE